jgi:hypothetical protein
MECQQGRQQTPEHTSCGLTAVFQACHTGERAVLADLSIEEIVLKVGVFAETYERSFVDKAFASAAGNGFSCVQFNLASSGVDTLPCKPAPERISIEIDRAARRHCIETVAVAGTCNMAHPQSSARQEGVERLKNVIAWAPAFRVPVAAAIPGAALSRILRRRNRKSCIRRILPASSTILLIHLNGSLVDEHSGAHQSTLPEKDNGSEQEAQSN